MCVCVCVFVCDSSWRLYIYINNYLEELRQITLSTINKKMNCLQ